MKNLSAALAHVATFGLAPALGALGAASPALAQAPDSVAALLKALPELPTSAEQAARWVDKNGRIVHPPLLQLQAALAEHRQAVQQLASAQGRTSADQGPIATNKLLKGMQEVGIDLQRMQTDAAYAQQVQDRMRRMTPAEQMAMAQRMSQPLNQDTRYVNQAAAMEEDKPAAKAAAQAGQSYAQLQPQRFERHAALWAETEDAVRRLNERKLVVDAAKPALEWDNPGCDPRCRGLWETYAARMLPLMEARESEVLALRRAAVQRQRSTVAPDIATADRHLQATAFGLASTSQVHRDHIVGYDGAAMAEIQGLFDRTVEAVQRAALLPHCGKQAVLVPLAACR